MSFGRNPHVAKAQAAEQKALAARDESARVLAWREAARLWERAAEREAQDKKRTEYEQLAEAARARADGADPEQSEDDQAELETQPNPQAMPGRWLN